MKRFKDAFCRKRLKMDLKLYLTVLDRTLDRTLFLDKFVHKCRYLFDVWFCILTNLNRVQQEVEKGGCN